jgi:hypothetical protein
VKSENKTATSITPMSEPIDEVELDTLTELGEQLISSILADEPLDAVKQIIDSGAPLWFAFIVQHTKVLVYSQFLGIRTTPKACAVKYRLRQHKIIQPKEFHVYTPLFMCRTKSW